MPTRRFYANAAPTQQISAQINSTATTLTAPSFTGWPSQYPFFATLELGTANEEIVSVTGITGTTATIVRAQDGSTAISHLAGATFDCTVVRQDFDEANAHTSATAGVHGVSGSVTGTTDVQTLTNKTLASPAVTGTLAGANETLSGTLSVTGASTLGAVTASGLTVTGTSTLSGVNASGAVSLSGAGTGLAVTNNLTVGGTATITGAHTAASYTASGNGQVTGVVKPTQYANEAAAGTATAGLIVYLTAPTTNGYYPGIYVGNGSQWVPAERGIFAQLRQTTAQSIPNAAFTALTWQLADFDTASGLSGGIWTAPLTGIYRLAGAVEFLGNATGRRLAYFDLGGAGVLGSQREIVPNATTGSNSIALPSMRVAITAGQTVRVVAWQNSGAALSTSVVSVNASYLLIEQVA